MPPPPANPPPEVEPLDPHVAALVEALVGELVEDGVVRRVTRRAVAVVVAVAVVASFGVWRAEVAVDRARTAATAAADVAEDLVEENTDRLVAECENRNDFRRLFRDYLQASATPLTPEVLQALPGYTDLDPATRNYVDALVAVLNASALDTAQVRAEYVEAFPVVSCTELRAELEAQRAESIERAGG